jgi:serine/threonine protein kinase
MATGMPALAEKTPDVHALDLLQTSTAPPTALNPDLPPALEEVILRAIEKDPDRRYQKASEMLFDLQLVQTGAKLRGQATSGGRSANDLMTASTLEAADSADLPALKEVASQPPSRAIPPIHLQSGCLGFERMAFPIHLPNSFGGFQGKTASMRLPVLSPLLSPREAQLQ